MCEKKINIEEFFQKPNDDKIYSDVLGSYTGVPADENDTPVQDADDL